MHQQDAKERGVLSKHLEKNPWLIEPTWMLNKTEGRIATWIREKFGLEETGQADDNKRVDFFCVAVGGTLHIVEIKRGKYIAKVKDFTQADRYRKYVETRFQELTDPKAIRYAYVQSHLISARLHGDAQSTKEAFARQGWVFFTTWDDLIERSKQSHYQYRQILQATAEEQNGASFAEKKPRGIDVPPETGAGKTRRTKAKRG